MSCVMQKTARLSNRFLDQLHKFLDQPPPPNRQSIQYMDLPSSSLHADLSSSQLVSSGFNYYASSLLRCSSVKYYSPPEDSELCSYFGSGAYGRSRSESRSPSRSTSPSRDRSESLNGSFTLSQLITLQSAEGFWTLDQSLASLIGCTLVELKSTCPAGCTEVMWATLLVLALLEKQFTSHRDEWDLVAMKAEFWLQSQPLQSTVDSLKQIASQNLK